jgi:CRISPR/Cas system-associated protein endoribonuclease Cas2
MTKEKVPALIITDKGFEAEEVLIGETQCFHTLDQEEELIKYLQEHTSKPEKM